MFVLNDLRSYINRTPILYIQQLVRFFKFIEYFKQLIATGGAPRSISCVAETSVASEEIPPAKKQWVSYVCLSARMHPIFTPMFAALCCVLMITCSAGDNVAVQLEGEACYEMAAAIPRLKFLTGVFNNMQLRKLEFNNYYFLANPACF